MRSADGGCGLKAVLVAWGHAVEAYPGQGEGEGDEDGHREGWSVYQDQDLSPSGLHSLLVESIAIGWTQKIAKANQPAQQCVNFRRCGGALCMYWGT